MWLSSTSWLTWILICSVWSGVVCLENGNIWIKFSFVNMFFCYSFNFRTLNVTRLTVNVVGMWREYTSNIYIAPSSFYLLLSPLFCLYINKLEFFSCLWLLLTITSTWFDRCKIDNTILFTTKNSMKKLEQ